MNASALPCTTSSTQAASLSRTRIVAWWRFATAQRWPVVPFLTAMFMPGRSASAMDLSALFFPASRQRPVSTYGSEKSIDSARSGVAVMEETMASMRPVFSAGMSPSKAVFSMITGRPSRSPMALERSTLTPAGRPCSSIVSNGGYASSIPTRSAFDGGREQPASASSSSRATRKNWRGADFMATILSLRSRDGERAQPMR